MNEEEKIYHQKLNNTEMSGGYNYSTFGLQMMSAWVKHLF